jgi:hypothetical protein
MRSTDAFRTRLLVLAVAVAAAVSPAFAQDAAAPAAGDTGLSEPGVVTPEARAVIDRMTKYLNSLESFTIEAQASRDEPLAYGYKLQNNEWATMTVRRPDGLRVDVDGDIKKRSYFYDGKTLTMYAPDTQVFARTPAPATIGEVVNGLLNAGVEMPLIDILAQGFSGSLLDEVRVGLRVDDSTIDGVATDHLAFRQAAIDWQVWVAKNGQPKRFLITTRYEVGDPQYEVTLRWHENPRIAASTFAFAPPKGTREIPFARPTLPAAPSDAPAAESP